MDDSVYSALLETILTVVNPQLRVDIFLIGRTKGVDSIPICFSPVRFGLGGSFVIISQLHRDWRKGAVV
jgi:hypothetical protein